MPNDSFVHLHLHIEYSLVDGGVRMKELMRKAALNRLTPLLNDSKMRLEAINECEFGKKIFRLAP